MLMLYPSDAPVAARLGQLVFLCALLSTVGVWVATSHAQAPGSAAAMKKSSDDLIGATRAFSRGDDNGAINQIARDLAGSPGGAGYEYQLGSTLSQAAFLLYDLGYTDAAKKAAAEALRHLDIKGSLARASALVQAQAEESAGLLQERINRDFAAALASYTLALQNDNKRPSATAGLVRVRLAVAQGLR